APARRTSSACALSRRAPRSSPSARSCARIWTGSSRASSSHRGGDRLRDARRLGLDLAVGEAEGAVAALRHPRVAGAVVLEGLAAAVVRPDGGLCDDSVLREQEVDLLGLEPGIDARLRQLVASAEGEEQLLEIA